MISALFNQTTYVAAKKMLDATVLRHQAIASNLANLETPGYRRIDLAPSFQAHLQQALAAGDTHRLARLQPRLQVDPAATLGTRDGNTVSLESELTELQENLIAHALETQLISSTLLRLRLAITGRPF